MFLSVQEVYPPWCFTGNEDSLKAGQGCPEWWHNSPATPETLRARSWACALSCPPPPPPTPRQVGLSPWVVAQPGRNPGLWPGSPADCLLFLPRSFG